MTFVSRRCDGTVFRRELLTGVSSTAGLLFAGRVSGYAQSGQPTERWRYVPGSISNLVGHDGSYYVVAGESIQSIDATSGEIEWTASAGGSVQEDAVAIDTATGTLVIASESGTALCVALANGSERWRRSIGGEGVGGVIANGTVYLLSRSGISAIDTASGDQQWSYTIPQEAVGEGQGIAVATTDAGPVPVYHTGTRVVGLDDSGTEQWRIVPSTFSFADVLFRFNDNNLVTQGQYVYFQGDSGPNDADPHGMIDASGGQLLWERSDAYTNLTDLRGGPATFDGNVVNSGAGVSVLSVPGGSQQWRTGITAYDSIRGTSNALYVCGGAEGTAVVRSFDAGGAINWTLEFGSFEMDTNSDSYQFYNVPPAVTDGSVLVGVRPGNGEDALRCYELPESEWLAQPQRESTPNGGTAGGNGDSSDGTTPVNGGTRTAVGTPPGGTNSSESDGGDGPSRGFFTNRGDGPLSAVRGSNLTALSSLITVAGIVVTIYDLLRGDND